MTEESHSETSSDEQVLQYLQALESAQEQLNELRWQLDANNHILTVLLQEAGGVIELSKETLANTPIARELSITDKGDHYVLEGVFHDDAEPTG